MTLFKPMRNAGGGGGSFPNVFKLLFDLKTATFLASINLPMLIGTVSTTQEQFIVYDCSLSIETHQPYRFVPDNTSVHPFGEQLTITVMIIEKQPWAPPYFPTQNRILKTALDGGPVLSPLCVSCEVGEGREQGLK